MSMLFSERAVRLLERSLLIMNGFLWGRNRERSIELALLLREVTPSVARFPCSSWRAVTLLINTIKIKRDLIHQVKFFCCGTGVPDQIGETGCTSGTGRVKEDFHSLGRLGVRKIAEGGGIIIYLTTDVEEKKLC